MLVCFFMLVTLCLSITPYLRIATCIDLCSYFGIVLLHDLFMLAECVQHVFVFAMYSFPFVVTFAFIVLSMSMLHVNSLYVSAFCHLTF